VRPALRKTLKWGSLSLATLLLLLVAALCWLLLTTSGARWIAGTVTSRFAPQVAYASIDGTIAGALTVKDFRFQGAPDAARIQIAELTVEPTLRMLLSRRLRIENASVTGLVVTLPEQPGPEEPDEPMWVAPPLDVVVDDFALRDGRVVKGGDTLFVAKQLDVSARWTAEELHIDRLALLPGDIEGSLDVKGRVTPAGRLVRGEIEARWNDVVIPASYAGQVIATEGMLDFDGTPEKYLVKGSLVAGPPGRPTQIRLDVSGTDAFTDIRELALEQGAGQLSAKGRVEFEPVAWQLAVNAREFDPGELLAGWSGRVNLDASSRGVLAEAGPSGSLSIGALSGELRGRPLAGHGDLEFAAPATLAGELQLSSGRSRVDMRGNSTDGRSVDATVKLAVASLGDWLPDSAGSLNGDFRIRGAWPELAISGTADGRSLALMEYRASRLSVQADVKSPLDPDGKATVRAQGIQLPGLSLSSVEVDASGNQRRHVVSAKARTAPTDEADAGTNVLQQPLDASVRIAGGLAPGGWSGEVSSLTLDAPEIANLRLREPARVEFRDGGVSVSRACLVDDGSALCASIVTEASGTLKASYSFDDVPLGLANTLAPAAMPGQLRGALSGEGDVSRGADGQWFGDSRITSPRAQMVMLDDEPNESVLGQRTLLLYENLELNARLEGTSATATLTAGLQNGGSLKAELGATNLTAESPGLRGKVNANMPTLAPFGGFVPTVGNLDGEVNAEILLAGTLAAPEITGNVDATRLQADLGKLGIELRDGRVRGEARAGGGFTLAASVASGKGHIELAGTMSDRGVIEAKILGQNFQAADIPAANVIVTPDLVLTGDPKAYLLRGELTIPRADINLQKLPQDKSPNASPDVVVIRDGKEVQSETQANDLPLTATITVKLGEEINITGFGLESTVQGQLVVREAPGAPTTGSGQLLVAGTYKAYGQDLTIKDGRLLFAGTPLDNPRLAIVAMREINDDLSTGLRIAGSAKAPVITVISDPNVGEADALSYLVTGRSLNSIGSASGSSQDALASATRSLEGAGAGLVAKRIGARLGLDEASVEENEMIGGSALTIGEYLSPRLYLSYGVGLFDPGEVIALRYKLSEDVGVRIQRGSEETRAGVEYRIEK
jgi:translocation and assembly module TamB